MNFCLPVRNDNPSYDKKDLTSHSGRLLHSGEGNTDLWEVDVRDEDDLKSLVYLHGEPVRPKYSLRQQVEYLGDGFEIARIEYHNFDFEWVVGYELADANGKLAFVLDSQLK